MTSADLAPPAARSTARFAEWWRIWRVIPREEWIGFTVLGMAVAGVTILNVVRPSGPDWRTYLVLVLNEVANALSLLLALNVANRAVDRGAARSRTYAAAVLCASVVGACIGAAIRWAMGWPTDPLMRDLEALIAWLPYTTTAYTVIAWTLYGGFTAYVYVDRREARRMVARVHDATLRHAAEARAMYESQLQTLQARVEPAFLSGTLGRIRDLYERNATTASSVLDQLIVYLRAAMPHMRETAAPVVQELDLVRSWIAIVDSAHALDVTILCHPEAAGARIPSLLLLPLIQGTVEGQLSGHADRAALRLEATVTGDMLAIGLILDAHAAARTPALPNLDALRERLAALFGHRATLEAVASDGRVHATLRIPCEPFARATAR